MWAIWATSWLAWAWASLMGSAAADPVKIDRTVTASRTTVADPYRRLRGLAVLALTVETVSTNVTTGEQPSGDGLAVQSGRHRQHRPRLVQPLIGVG